MKINSSQSQNLHDFLSSQAQNYRTPVVTTGHIKYGDVNGKKPSGELDATTYLENGIILSIFEQQMSIQRMCGHSWFHRYMYMYSMRHGEGHELIDTLST